MDKDELKEVRDAPGNTQRDDQSHRSGGDGRMSKTDADEHAKQVKPKREQKERGLTDCRGARQSEKQQPFR